MSPSGFSRMNSPLDPKRTVAELKELRAPDRPTRTARNASPSRRTWFAARAWLRQKLAALPVEIHADAAGNLWSTLSGEANASLLIGGHMDSVPERRLARRLPERARGARDSAPHQRPIRRQAARDGAPRGLGGRGGRALRQKPVRLLRVLGHSRHGRGAGPARQGRHHACPTR